MTTERIRKRLTGGFKPFELRLTDGRRVPVPHPEFIMVGKGVVVIMDQQDDLSVIDALHIVSLDDLPASRRNERAGPLNFPVLNHHDTD